TIFLGGTITTSGGQVYASAVVLTNNTVLSSTGGGDITFSSTVDGGYNLTVNTSGITAFGGAVGGTTPLATLTTDAAGLMALNGGSVTTSGSQNYLDSVILGTDTTLNSMAGGNITFGSTINGAHSLTLNTTGTTTFNGGIRGTTALLNLVTGAAG